MKGLLLLFFIVITTFSYAQKKGISIFRHFDITNAVSTDKDVKLTCDQKLAFKKYVKNKSYEIVSEKINIGHINPDPFIAFSCKWNSSAVGSVKLFIKYFKKIDNQLIATEYEPITIDAHNEQKEIVVSNLMYLDKTATFVQLKVVGTTDTEGYLVRGLKLNFFSPYGNDNSSYFTTNTFNLGTAAKTNDYSESYFTTSKSGDVPAEENTQACPCPLPGFITRTQWNCPQGAGLVSGVGTSTAVTHLIVHHSAGNNTATDWNAVVLSIWNFHTGTNGYSDIGYNWLIAPNGQLYEGRGSNSFTQNVTGAHFCGTNANTMGVCLIGTYTTVDASAAMKATLAKILAWKACQQNIPPIGTALHASSSLMLNRISGHRDGCATDCPGTTFYNTLPAVRLAVQDSIAACGAVQPCTPSLNVTFSGCPSNTLNFTTTNIQNGGAAPTFTWFVNNTQVATGSSYTFINANNGDKVYARMTSNAACATPTTVNSDTLTVSCIVTTPVINIDGLEYCTIAPNPNNGQFNVQLKINRSVMVSYRLLTADGKVILTINKERVQGVVNKQFAETALPSGNYLLEILIDNKTIVKQILVK